jgi:FkbM family methyltransferase
LVAASNPLCQKCYSFEPNPTIFDTLLQNIRLNHADIIDAYSYAVAETIGIERFSAPEYHSGIGKITDKALSDASSILVKTINYRFFDELASNDLLKKIVKIDVEGHEPKVIDQLLQSKIRTQLSYLYFEVGSQRYDLLKVKKCLKDAGYVQIARYPQGNEINLLYASKFGATSYHTGL